MSIGIERTKEIREEIKDLDLTKYQDKNTYKKRRREFIAVNEESDEKGKKRVYRDTQNKRTVGIGFNMDRRGAKKEWDDAFKPG